jgi:hypothetical protein
MSAFERTARRDGLGRLCAEAVAAQRVDVRLRFGLVPGLAVLACTIDLA